MNQILFFVYVVISNLYLFQEVVLLNPCLIFSKNLILPVIDKVTTGTQSLASFIRNIAPVIILCSDNTQSSVQDKSSSISQSINGKSRDLQTLLQYLSGIVTSTFKTGTGSCGDSGGHGDNGGWDPPRFGGACGGLCGLCDVFPNICFIFKWFTIWSIIINIINFIYIIVPYNFWCHGIILTIL